MILEGVGRRYAPRGPWVLREVGLGLPAGTLTRVNGTNGTGKSTLLRLVAGIDAPSEGRITARPARTAYVPERFPAALPLTARGYLVHLARVQGLDGRTARSRAGEWLDRFGAAAYGNTPLAALSKGTSQKVAVAQALLAEPDLLVLDEAWTGLDAAARAELDRAVRERVAAGARVVFVDHDPGRLEGEADAEYAVSDGRLHRTEPAGPAPSRAVHPRAGTSDPVHPGAGTRDPVHPGAGTRDPAHPRAGTSDPVHPGAGTPDPVHPGAGTPDPVHPGAGTRTRITASGGTRLPEGLPGAPDCAWHGHQLVATVHADHSDAILRALLDAGWHIEHLAPEATTEGTRA
ncbi:ATP-binding cassette domain-containing protein [Streptomyces sp. NPDC058084]|uniref:ATP-binding cassette domain-containing protein n=1 Tax=Streptomyces sp. NPDC058084 TaxID=3346333 RepID=UPI0036EEF969